MTQRLYSNLLHVKPTEDRALVCSTFALIRLNFDIVLASF